MRSRTGAPPRTGLTPEDDAVPSACVVNFDNLHTLPREALGRRITTLSSARMHQACSVLGAATGC